jgi:hypothetical protein
MERVVNDSTVYQNMTMMPRRDLNRNLRLMPSRVQVWIFGGSDCESIVARLKLPCPLATNWG